MNVLVFGSTGALGSEIVSILSKGTYTLSCVAFRQTPNVENIIIERGSSLTEQYNTIEASLSDRQFDAIINVAGGITMSDLLL
jgi:dTDP-4-dehydrorhamnose reductase